MERKEMCERHQRALTAAGGGIGGRSDTKDGSVEVMALSFLHDEALHLLQHPPN